MNEPAPRHPLFELTRAHLFEFLREPGALFWVFIFPMLVAVGLGIAFRAKPPDKLRIGVLPEVSLKSALAESEDLEVVEISREEAPVAIRKGKVDLVIDTSTSAAFVFRYDPMQPQSRTAKLAVDAVLERASGRKDVLAKNDAPVQERGERYIDFLMPGLVGINLMGSSMWGIGYAIVVTRSRKLMKRFAATPMRREHYLLSFILSRFTFLFFEVGILILFGVLVFDVAIRGSLLSLGLLAMLGAISFAGIALLVGARPRSVESVSGWMNLVMMPMYFLSGVFFSHERFPEFMHPFIRLLPLTAMNDSLRGVINDGKSVFELLPEIGILAAWTVISFTLALKLFRWK
jgi:ABC-type polysaccharide/polyol phosphate export permease